ncbi:MAG TPA: alternative ribosome rescue aminoacyl-tRNA hydrolase ArfB [Gemmatimonadaceae bacterium]|nr:alternative ribosome rescue aminoacyl-tRNA hydrolase ArfB [Gemmatimonadaceae bacterium]
MARSKTDLWTDDGHLAVNARVSIPAAELEIRASRAGGPGGQHVNTSSTRVEVTWGALESGALDDVDRERLRERLASRLDSSGTLRVVAADTRSQSQNRELALQRLAGLVRDALIVPKKRRPTKPTRASKMARLDTKKRRATRKKDRRWSGDD